MRDQYKKESQKNMEHYQKALKLIQEERKAIKLDRDMWKEKYAELDNQQIEFQNRVGAALSKRVLDNAHQIVKELPMTARSNFLKIF